MKILKIILLAFLLQNMLSFVCFADTYNGVPIYQIDYSELTRPTPSIMPLSTYHPDFNFVDFTKPKQNIQQNNYEQNNNYSGSTHFIYSSSPNPSYCIPASSYSICH